MHRNGARAVLRGAAGGNTCGLPDRQEARRVSEPLFPEGVRAAMRMGTSSAWAADLTAADLPALLWMVGEYGRRAGHV